MAVKISSERDSRRAKSDSSQIAAVYKPGSVARTLGDTRRGAYLDHLGHSIGEFAWREGLEERSIDKDVLGLPECADQVFAVGGIDRGFSSDAGIDHG